MGTAPWTDTGIDVKAGQEFYFEAEGTVSLQKDNPVASCGPEGLALRTMQQPLADQNLGCLIGRVVERTEVEEDKDRGEKTIREFGPMFGIGKQVRLAMPLRAPLPRGQRERDQGQRRRIHRQHLPQGRAARGLLNPAVVLLGQEFFQELDVVFPLQEVRVGQDRQVQGDVRLDPDDGRHFQGRLHLLDGQETAGGEGDDLGDQES